METSKHSGWVLGSIIFVLGGCGIAYEYTFSKVASDLLGNSVQQWAIVIAIMLFCMGVGAEIQRYISAKRILPVLLYSQLALWCFSWCFGLGIHLTKIFQPSSNSLYSRFY